MISVSLVLALVSAAAASAQPPTRLATTAEALIASAGFFQGRTVVVQQKLITEGEFTRLAEASKPIYVFFREQPSDDEGEVRGEFWDLGRIDAADSRFAGYDLTHLVERVNRGQWPVRDQIYIIVRASLAPSSPPRAPTVRAIALAPQNFVDREVRVVGRFRGRNLYGELPYALGKDKWDFVIQSADGAVWVTGVRPRGKGFDLDPTKRVDTGRWVEVRGVVRQQGLTPYIDAEEIALGSEPDDAPVEVKLPPPPPQPPPEVIFSAPIQDDHDVDRTAPVRIQFSRDVDPRSLQSHVTVSYAGGEGTALPPLPEFKVAYNDAAHAIVITFAEPLERFMQVKVELGEGILALDGQALKPFTLTFTTGR
ncbi:MAG TPA: Ig-like domain-containing protein [Vicinamibacterales bacterium]